MNIVGIITEYNPFHNGHKLHLEETKKITNADGVICVMSGNFVQRGLPAIFDKWTRAQMAVLNGVDLVIELPTLFSVSSAEFFAKGAIDILDSTGIVQKICFGSEAGSINLIFKVAKVLSDENAAFKELLKKNLSEGKSFVSSRSQALLEFFHTHTELNIDENAFNNFFGSSNNILAIEYCKNILKINSKIEPVTIQREGSAYNDLEAKTKFASATSIRELLYNDINLEVLIKYMPLESIKIISNILETSKALPTNNTFFEYIKYKLITNPGSLSMLPESSEGLANKFTKEIISVNSIDSLIMHVKSKRYTYTRLSRLLCQYFIGFENYDIADLRLQTPKYLRVLALNSKGAQILKEIKRSSSLEIINKFPKTVLDPMLSLDLAATNAYSLINPNTPFNADYTTSPFVLR